jgi:hypothetical protein
LRSYLTPTETANWPAISEGALLWSQSLADDASGASHEACFELLPARQPALIWHFDLHFGERRLSTDPRLKRPSHWRLPVDFPGVGAMRYRVELKLSAISHRLGSSITAL